MKKCIAVVAALLCILSLAGCMGNSGNLTEGFTNETNTFNSVGTENRRAYAL